MANLSQTETGALLPWLPHVIKKVQSLRFGSVQIKIHDGQVVVVESLEQKRFHPISKDSEGKPELRSQSTASTKQ